VNAGKSAEKRKLETAKWKLEIAAASHPPFSNFYFPVSTFQ